MLPDSRRPRRLAIVISEIDDEGDLDPEVVGGRDDRLDLGDRRGGGDRHGHHVVDQQRRRGDQPEDRGEVGPAPRRRRRRRSGRRGRPGGTRSRRRPAGWRSRSRPGSRAGTARSAPASDEDPQDLLGRVGRRADRVGAEDRERLLLRQPLADLLLGRQRPAEDDGPDRARATARSGVSRRRWPPAWPPAGPGRCSGSTGRAGARPGRAGPPVCGPAAAAGLRSTATPSRWARSGSVPRRSRHVRARQRVDGD